MSALVRAVLVIAIGVWMLGTAIPGLARIWEPYPDNGISLDFDGVITDVAPRSPASAAGIEAGDRVVPPLAPALFRDPPGTLTFKLNHHGTVRAVTLTPQNIMLSRVDRAIVALLFTEYSVFLIVGSLVLLLRPSAMTWSFYLYCVLRRYGDLGFYWPGSNAFFWANFLTLVVLGSTGCVFVTMFALRFPSNRLEKWRRYAMSLMKLLLLLFPIATLYVIVNLGGFGRPSQGAVNWATLATAIVYAFAAAVFAITFLQSHGDERQRLKWVLVFPVVLAMRVVAILAGDGILPWDLPDWFSQALAILGISVPIAVAYAVVRRRVFDVQFAISRALVYGSITSLVAGTFLLLDWFMGKQFAQTRFTLTAEIILALAIGSWLNMLHRNVDRLIDSTFFRQRHMAEERLKKAAAAVLRAESHDVVDRFLVHEPIRALELTSAAIFRRNGDSGAFERSVETGWDHVDTRALTSEDPLVLHLLAEEAPVRLADVVWGPAEWPLHVGDAVLAMHVLLRDALVAIVLYGPHRNAADIDPDEVRSIALLVERAGAAYDHIEARTLREQVASLIGERDAQRREIELLRSGAS